MLVPIFVSASLYLVNYFAQGSCLCVFVLTMGDYGCKKYGTIIVV